ncbi:MAG: trypsin-like peptidase domain-containing protein [Deltaproteobacteria bacterium]|nr:trypsin-like peptidase domain-containing protein [Deltaproteobacteria bacterium]
MLLLLAVLALSSVLAAAVVIGAHVLVLIGAGGAIGVTLASAATLVLALVAPLLIAGRLIALLKSRRPAQLTLGAVLLWNAGLLALAFGLIPRASREAVDARGAWMLAGSLGDRGAAALKQTTALIFGPATSTSTSNSTSTSTTPAGERGAQPESKPQAATATVAQAPVTTGVTVPASAPDRPQGPFSARELFARRADTVVLIKAQTRRSITELFSASTTQKKRKKKAKAKADQTWVESIGSGFLVSVDGLFVTNHHVLGDVGRAAVFLRDGRALHEVEILVKDPTNDLVLGRVDARDLPSAPLAEGTTEIGAPAFAIGSPLGLEFTLTQGIVSAFRDYQGTKFLQMQTDVAPGSSGGPLFDERGEVIGVNTAVRGPGLNFAVDVTHVRKLLAAPRKRQKLERYVPGLGVSWLEVEGAPITPVGRMNLLSLVQAVGTVADSCVEILPPQARIDVRLEKAELSSNLGLTVDDCLRERFLRLTVLLVGLALANDETEAPLRISARIEGLSLVDGESRPAAERSLLLRLHRGDPDQIAPASAGALTATASPAKP